MGAILDNNKESENTLLKEKIKMMIELSENVTEADSIIEEYENIHDYHEKIEYLRGMFDFELVGRCDGEQISAAESEKMDYFAILNAIIKSSWED